MVFPGARLFRAPIWCPPAGWLHARGREHCRRSIGWVRFRFGEGAGQFDRRRAREGLNPCARESKARTGRFLRGKLMSDHGIFSSYEDHKERRMGKIRGGFSGMHRALDDWMLARAPTSPAQGLRHHGPRYFNFAYFRKTWGLEKLGLVDQSWLERNLSELLLRVLVVGRRQHCRSRLLSIWSKEVR